MAQGAGIATATPVNGTPMKDENWEILEYEKILRFRDQVLNGTHPRVKVPPNLVGKLNASPRTVSSPSNPAQQRSTTHQAQSSLSTSSPLHDGIQNKRNSTDAQHPQPSRSAATVPNVSKSATELDPIFLAKSEELVKAEIQLQRQRIERTLRDQIELRKIAVKQALQTQESLPDFDLSEVLSKAQALIQPIAAAELDIPARPAAPDSDSFDENTFYSSQHDTPDNLSLASQEHTAPGEVEMLDTAMVDQPSALAHSRSAYPRSPDLVQSRKRKQQPWRTEVIRPFQKQVQPNSSGHSSGYNLRNKQPAKNTVGEKSDEPVILEEPSSSAKDSSNPSSNHPNETSQDSTDSNGAQPPNRRSLSTDAPHTLTHPIIRTTHDLSPVAPQAARVSSLLNTKGPVANELAHQTEVAASNNVSIVSSPEGPKSNRAKKRQERRKKREGRKNPSKQAASPVPYIKPEPRSPSPFEPLSRPLKRQRQSIQNADGLDYDEPRRDRQEERPAISHDDSVAPRPAAQLRSGYETDPLSYSPRPIRRERDDIDYRRIASLQHARRPQSPASYPLPYSPTGVRQVQPTPPPVFERPAQEPVRYYREEQIPRREIIDLDRERSRSPVYRDRRTPLPMAPPPRAVPERVVVDAHGRQYYAPAPLAEEKYYQAPSSTSVRYSVAPSVRPREVIRYSVAPTARGPDREVVYERAPVRPPPEIIEGDYEERRIVYRRPVSPQFAVPPARRVIPQSEREGTVDLRAYREREYSTRPATTAPQDEYTRIRGPVERRPLSHYPEAPGEYVPRASMHPEPIRYEIPREYVGRLQSVHPEALGREFASSVRPEPRREMIREASVRPGEPGLTRREYAAPPPMDGERYPEPRREMIREASVRPGEPGLTRREYAAPPPMEGDRYLEPRREIMREASVRPGEPGLTRREYAAPPPMDANRYEFARPIRRAADEPIYIDRPREARPDALNENSRRPPPMDGDRYEIARPVRRAADEPVYIDGPREAGPDALNENARREMYR